MSVRMLLRRAAIGVTTTVLFASGVTVLTAPAAAAATTCRAYTVLAVRGTGESGTLGTRLPTTISAIQSRKGASKVLAVGVSYPASFNYLASMSTGRANLKSQINTYLNNCRSTRLILIGYSQGAHVVGDVAVGLSAAQRSRVAGIGLIGDPMFNPALRGGVTHNGSRGGMWGKRSSWPSGLYVTDVCNNGDKVCASYSLVDSLATGISGANHQNYTTTKYSPVSGRSGANAVGYNLGGRA